MIGTRGKFSFCFLFKKLPRGQRQVRCKTESQEASKKYSRNKQQANKSQEADQRQTAPITKCLNCQYFDRILAANDKAPINKLSFQRFVFPNLFSSQNLQSICQDSQNGVHLYFPIYNWRWWGGKEVPTFQGSLPPLHENEFIFFKAYFSMAVSLWKDNGCSLLTQHMTTVQSSDLTSGPVPYN